MRDFEKVANVFHVPNLGGKKIEGVGAKISAAAKEALDVIAEREDRTVSYLVRELLMRGLAHHFHDGEIRTTKEEDEWILKGPTEKFSEVRDYGKAHDERAPQRKRKTG